MDDEIKTDLEISQFLSETTNTYIFICNICKVEARNGQGYSISTLHKSNCEFIN